MNENSISYYLAFGEAVEGPYTIEQLRSKWNQGTLTLETPLCRVGTETWGAVKDIAHEFKSAVPAQINPYSAPQARMIAPPLAEAPSGEWTDAELKKLYYRSCNVTAITGLVCLATLAVIGICFLPEAELGFSKAILIGIAVFYVIAIVGLIKRTSWGRICGIIVSILSLINFPLGTVIGIVELFAFFGAPNLFGENRVTHRELKAEFKLRKRNRKLARRARA